MGQRALQRPIVLGQHVFGRRDRTFAKPGIHGLVWLMGRHIHGEAMGSGVDVQGWGPGHAIQYLEKVLPFHANPSGVLNYDRKSVITKLPCSLILGQSEYVVGHSGGYLRFALDDVGIPDLVNKWVVQGSFDILVVSGFHGEVI